MEIFAFERRWTLYSDPTSRSGYQSKKSNAQIKKTEEVIFKKINGIEVNPNKVETKKHDQETANAIRFVFKDKFLIIATPHFMR